MVKARKPRELVSEDWYLTPESNPVVLPCTVHNLSDTGALISIEWEFKIHDRIVACPAVSFVAGTFPTATDIQTNPERHEAVIVREDEEGRYGIHFESAESKEKAKEISSFFKVQFSDGEHYSEVIAVGSPDMNKLTHLIELIKLKAQGYKNILVNLEDASSFPALSGNILGDLFSRLNKKEIKVAIINAEAVGKSFKGKNPNSPTLKHVDTIEAAQAFFSE